MRDSVITSFFAPKSQPNNNAKLSDNDGETMEISSDDHGDMTGVDTSESEKDKVYDDICD
jgi:hypothetical protein